MFVLGLTGSIGMGKSAIASFFQNEGIQVIDADQIVHNLYAKRGKAVQKIQQIFPKAIVDEAVDRDELSKYVVGNEEAMKQIESIVHPLVEQERQRIILDAKNNGEQLIVVDVPLLFETDSQKQMDAILVVSAPYDVQKARVMQRPNMTEQKFEYILSRQMPDEEKRQKADFVIDTTVSEAEMKSHVRALIQDLVTRKNLQ